MSFRHVLEVTDGKPIGPMSIDMYLSSLPAISADLATIPDSTHLTVSWFLLGFYSVFALACWFMGRYLTKLDVGRYCCLA